VIKHPLRQRLLFAYGEAPTSPSKVAAALGERVNLVSYHTGVLVRAGCVELVRTEALRGATEHFYRSHLVSEIDDADWERVPLALRRALVRLTLDLSRRESVDALPRGGMDSSCAHVSRRFLHLDDRGIEELAELLRATTQAVEEIERASRARNTADGTPWELVVLSFAR
jgi:hypothetical protein